MLRLKKLENFNNPYNIGDKVEFYSIAYDKWIKGIIVGFEINNYIYQAVIKCENKYCKFHYICICSLYLRKID